MHSHICEELSKTNAGIIFVEGPIDALREGVRRGNGFRGRIPKSLRASGRGDIVLVRPDCETWAPYGIIEVKRLQSTKGWESDLERLCSAMLRYGQKRHELNFACLGAYIQANGAGNFENAVLRLQDVVAEATEKQKGKLRIELRTHEDKVDGVVESMDYDGETALWGAFSVSVMLKGMHFDRKLKFGESAA